MMSTDRLNELRAQLYGSRPEIDELLNEVDRARGEERRLMVGWQQTGKAIHQAIANENAACARVASRRQCKRGCGERIAAVIVGRRIHEFFGS